MLEKNALDCISTDLVSQIVERSSDSGVAPTGIIASHAEAQFPYFGCGSRTTGASSFAPVILSRDQLSVPSEQSIWSHQGLDLEEAFPTDLLGLRRDAAALTLRTYSHLMPSREDDLDFLSEPRPDQT